MIFLELFNLLVDIDFRDMYINILCLAFKFYMKAKGLSNDISGPMANSIEDVERLDRSTSISTGRSWVDSSIKMNVCKVIVYYFFHHFLL